MHRASGWKIAAVREGHLLAVFRPSRPITSYPKWPVAAPFQLLKADDVKEIDWA
jgi:hypothetical protein